jgi:tight adherence protein C
VNPVLVALMAAGALVGVGVALAVSTFGRAHPDLAGALTALDERTPRPLIGRRPILARALRLLPGSVPEDDLLLIGWTTDRFLASRAASAVGYAAAGPALALVLWLLDAGLPLVVPGGFTVAGAIVGWLGPGRRVAQRADTAREELRFALVSYLQQVGLLRQGGAGVATSLSVPARNLTDGWAMRRIADELSLAERAGLMPWEGLRRFGAQVGVDELADLSAIAAGAGHDGGAVVDTLLARAESLRDELLADEHADAHRASAQMSTPGALQVFLISAWILFPAGVALLSL